MVQLWCDWAVLGKVARHHSPGFIVLAEALGTITFMLKACMLLVSGFILY